MRKYLPLLLFFLPLKAEAANPKLLCTRADYAAIRSSATISPWKEVVAGATNYLAIAKSEPYPFHAYGSGSDSQRQENANQMANLFGTYSLLYVLNTDNSGSITYRSSITALMDQWPATRADQPVSDGYNIAVPMNAAFMSMTLAFDLIYEDLPAVDQSSYTVMMDSWVAFSRGQSSSWALNNYGAYMTYSVFRDSSAFQIAADTACFKVLLLGNDVIYPPAVCNARQSYPHLSSEIQPGSQLNASGVNGSGSSYAWERLGGGSREKMGKWGGILVADYTGVLELRDDPKMANFYEWLFSAHTNPWNAKTSIGDSAVNQSVGLDFFQSYATLPQYANGLYMIKNAYLVSGRYSQKAQQLANRSVAVSTVPVIYPGEFIDYMSITSSDTTAQPPTSTVVQYGGAAFWSADTSTMALQGVLMNYHVTKDDHYHQGDWNGLDIAGYGETLLTNTGVGSAGTTGDILNFPPTFWRRSAFSGNTALIGNRNYAQDLPSSIAGNTGLLNNTYYDWNPNTTGFPSSDIYVGNTTATPLYGGDGIVESILSPGEFDYAAGLSTSPYVFRSTATGEVTYILGENQRNFIFVHADTITATAPGYWIVGDEFITSTQTTVNTIWHPYGTTASTTTASTEWSWLVSTRTGVTNTYLHLYAATPPSSVSFSSSPFSASPNDFVGSYLNAAYTVDSSSNARTLMVLYPSNPTHTKATFARLAPSGATGATISTGTVVDHILISSPSTTVTIATGTYRGRIGYARLISGAITSFFVRQGTSFDDGGTNRVGFNADDRISLYMKGITGKITASTTTNVDFYSPGITGVQFDGNTISGVDGTNVYSVDIPSGTYTVTFSSTTPDVPGCSCGGWTSGSCGAGGCSSLEIYQTRTCTPAACDDEEQCIVDESCSPPEPPPPSSPSHAGIKGRFKIKGPVKWK